MNIRNVLPAAAVVVSVSLGGCVATRSGAPGATVASQATGCGPAAAPAEPYDTYVPYALMRGHPLPIPLVGPTALSVSPSDSKAEFVHPIIPRTEPLGMPLQASVLSPWSGASSPDTWLVLVYGRTAPGNLSWSELVAAGAVVLAQSPAHGGDAASVRQHLAGVGNGDRALTVQIGPNDAVLVHSDPIDSANDRSYALFWSDGTRDMDLEALVPSPTLIDIARSLYCTP